MATVLGVIGIFLGLALFLILVYKGWSSFWVAPLCALLVAVFNHMNLKEAFVSNYIGGVGDVVVTLFSVILAGTMFGKVMTDTKATVSIANVITDKLLKGKKGETQVKLAILALMIIAAIFTMGGIDGFTLTFTVFPICVIMAKAVDIPKRFIPGLLCLNCAFMAAPGAPQVNNIMAQNALASVGYQVSSHEALIPGLVSTVIIAVFGFITLSKMIIKAQKAGEHFSQIDGVVLDEGKADAPNFFVALIPLIIVFICYSVVGMEFFFAALLGILAAIVLMWKYLPKKNEKNISINPLQAVVKSLNLGSDTFPGALMAVCTPAGLASVITATAVFGMVVDKISAINVHYIFLTIIVVCIVVAITSSNPVAIMVAIPLVIGVMTAQGVDVNAGAIARVAAISATTFETLPINGFVIVALKLAGTTHKESYKPMFLMTVLWTLVGAIVAGVMLYLFPGLA